MSELPGSNESPNPLPQEPYVREQVHLLYSGLPLSLISSLIIGLLLSISHLPVVGQAEIIYWNIMLGATLILRLILWQFWLNTGALYSSKFWLQLFRIGAWIAGIAWGAAPFLIYAEDNSIYQALLTFSMAGVVSGSLTSLSADRPSAVGFVVLAVCPLTLLLIMSQSPVAVAMSIMTLLFIIFVISSSGRTQKELRSQIQQNEALMALGSELEENRKIDAIINKIQSQYITEHNDIESLKNLIHETTLACDCDMGFIGEVVYDDKNAPYMRMLTYSYKKNNANYDFFNNVKNNDPHEFKNPNGLFGKILKLQKPVFSGNPRQDIRSSGTPENHPNIDNFLGIPVFRANELIAVIGLANAPKEFTQHTVNQLTPVANLISQLLSTSKLQKQHKQDIEVLEEASIQTKTILDDVADGIITIDQHGIIRSFNKAAETIFGYNAEQIIGHNIDQLMPEKDKKDHTHKISQYLNTGNSKIIGVGREVTGIRRNGKHFPMDLMVSKIKQKGEPLFIGIIRDISEKINLLEDHQHHLKKLATELRIPSHALSLALDIIDEQIHLQEPQNCKSIIKLAKTENNKLQKKIQALQPDEINTKSNKLISINAEEFFNNQITLYTHIASFRGSRLLVTSNIHHECILIVENHVEKVMAYFLNIAATINPPYSTIKMFIDQYRGKIRIYFIVKNISSLEKLIIEPEWLEHKQELLTSSAMLNTEKMKIPETSDEYNVIFIDFPIAINR